MRLWFDAATGLLARMTVRVPTPVGDLPQQVDYEDYRAVDGVKLPFVVKTNQGGETSTVTLLRHQAQRGRRRRRVRRAQAGRAARASRQVADRAHGK